MNEPTHPSPSTLPQDHVLLQHADELTASNEALRAGIEQSKLTTNALTRSADTASQLLAESLQLEGHLRGQVREIICAQEASRQQMSLRLHDEIAQTLLGLHVRLLALREEAVANDSRLREQTAGTQRMVEQCVDAIRRFTIELKNPL